MPVWFEPVSVPKSVRATRLLSLLDYVSPNERELAAMAAAARQQEQQRQQQQQQRVGGAGSSDEQRHGSAPATHTAAAAALPAAATAEAALRSMLPDIVTLLRAGVRHVVLTLGADGAALCTLAAGRRAVTGILGNGATLAVYAVLSGLAALLWKVWCAREG